MRKAIPFDVSIPNTETSEAFEEAKDPQKLLRYRNAKEAMADMWRDQYLRQPEFTNRLKKDLKRQKKRGEKPGKLEQVIDEICETGTAPAQCRPHNLIGNWSEYAECHVEPDWLLIYTVQTETVTFYRTGTHSDLFG